MRGIIGKAPAVGTLAVVSVFILPCSCTDVRWGEPLGVREAPSRTEADLLYKSLTNAHIDAERQLLSDRGIISCTVAGRPGWFVWMTSWGATGASFIGVFSEDLKLVESRRMQPLLGVSSILVGGVGRVILLREESGRGTGMRTEDVYLMSPEDLSSPLWRTETFHWLASPGYGYQNLLDRHVVMLMDVNNDGTDELVDIRARQVGIDESLSLSGDASVQCTVYEYHKQAHRFEPVRGLRPRALYPDPGILPTLGPAVGGGS
jgi:hypothetical protein